VAAFDFVKGAIFVCSTGLLLLVLERLSDSSPGLPVAFSGTAAGVETWLLRVAERVTGAK
jgi:hypothetical protein